MVLLVLEATLVLLNDRCQYWRCNSSKVPKLAFQAVLVILSHGPFDPRSLGQRRLHKNSNFGTKWSLKKWIREVVIVGRHQFFERNAGLWRGRFGFPHCWFVSISMPATKQWRFCLSWTPFSSLARYTGATIEAKVMLPKLAFQAVLVILSHDPFDLRSLQQRWMSKNYNFEAAASYPKYRLFREQKWSFPTAIQLCVV